MTADAPPAVAASDTAAGQGSLADRAGAPWQRRFGSSSPELPGLRFAFYGRVSTEDHQDPATSRSWQLLRAQALAPRCSSTTVSKSGCRSWAARWIRRSAGRRS
jgi:hypothetical protein